MDDEYTRMSATGQTPRALKRPVLCRLPLFCAVHQNSGYNKQEQFAGPSELLPPKKHLKV